MGEKPRDLLEMRKKPKGYRLAYILILTLIVLCLLIETVMENTTVIQNNNRGEINTSPDPFSPRTRTSTRSQLEYSDLVNYDDVLIVRNLNSVISMEITDYFQAKRNILPLNICNITTSTAETISRTNFDNEIRIPIENYLTSNGLENTINFIVTTKGVPLRISEEDTSDDNWNNPSTIDRASVDSELTLILGSYSMFIGGGGFMMPTPLNYIQNPYFNSSSEFSHSTYDIYLVTRLTGYDADDIKAYIDKVPLGVGKKGTFVFDVDPGRDNPNYKIGNDWMRGANATLTAKGFDVILDETNTFLTNIENVSGYTSWGSNDGRYSVGANQNYGFETDSNADQIPDNWYFENDIGNDQIDRNDTDKKYNLWSVRVNRTIVNSNYSAVSQNVTVKPDTRYFLRGQVNVSNVTGGLGAHLRLTAYDNFDQIVWENNGSARTGTTGNWVSLNQILFEPIDNISKLRVSVILSESKGEAYFDDIRLIEIKPHNSWNPGTLVETYVSTSGRTFNYPGSYGQSLAADLILDGVSGTKGYVYEPYLSATAHPDILYDEYTDGYYSAESYYMASEFLSWMDVVVCDPKLAVYKQSLIPDLSISSSDITFSNSIPQTGNIINIYANVHNLGNYTVDRATVYFYDGDPQIGGTLLGETLLNISASSQNQTSISWNTTGYIGNYNITVFLDPNDVYFELSELNNNASSTLTVHTGYPKADAGLDDSIDEDSPLSFNGSGSYDNSTIANYTWNFADGSFGYGVSPSHTFTTSGLFVVVLNVTNEFGLWDLDTVDITVNNVEPIANAGSDITDLEGVKLYFDASGSWDTPSDIPTLNYTWDFGDGEIGFGINPNHTYNDDGIYLVTLEAIDDDGDLSMDILNVTLDNVSPQITPISTITLPEDIPTTIQVYAYDVAGDAFSYFDNSTLFEINQTTGAIYYIPQNEDVGSHLINITVMDDDGGISYIEFLIIVQNSNDPPYIVSQPVTEAIEDLLYEYLVLVEDEDLNLSVPDIITYSLDTFPSGMTIDSSGGISWVPTESQVSQVFTVIVNVTDGDAFNVQIYQINVSNVNDDPVIISTPLTSINEDESYFYDVDAEDEDAGDTLLYSLDLKPQGMTIDEATGEISWLPTNVDTGEIEVIVNVTDSSGAFVQHKFTISVYNTNDAPILDFIGDLTAYEDLLFEFRVTGSDEDIGDELDYSDNSDLFQVDEDSGLISFVPSNDDVGVYTIRITVKDISNTQDYETLTFTILNVNDPPTIDLLNYYQLTEDVPFYLTVNADDVDLDDTVTFSDNTSLFDIDSLTGEISFTPNNDNVGRHVINISVEDKDGALDYVSVIFNIINVNDPPKIDSKDIPDSEDVVDIKAGESYNLTITVNDEDPGESLTFSDDTDLFDINSETGEISFTPKDKDAGTHTVKITVTDSEGDSDEIFLTFKVEGKKEQGIQYIWVILLIVIAILVVIIIFVFSKRKKGKTKGDEIVFLEEQNVVVETPSQRDFPPPPPPPQYQ
jgi:uncharacterized protein (TIGR03790 family)